ncbi:unnamed protein product [Caenorhabditis brenneri]
MNHYDKSRFDIVSHLTDIPMLGKQYVPELWRQIEETTIQHQSNQQRSQPEPINQRIYSPTTAAQNNDKGRPHSSATAVGGFGGLSRTIEKVILIFLDYITSFNKI